jgi:hypothetical protein
MYYVLCFLVGVVVGGICLFLYVAEWHARIKAREAALAPRAKAADDAVSAANAKEQALERHREEFDRHYEDFKQRIISYDELASENKILKRDLQNIDVNLHKLELDVDVQQRRQRQLDERSRELAKRYLNETVKAVVSAIGPSNFAACKQRLVDVITRCRDIGFDISSEEENRLLGELRTEFENAVRAQFEREEQARVKAQIREEEKLRREVDRELKQLERERAAIQAALDQALAAAKDHHSAEIERLKSRLAEAEEKSRRALSLAQQTKAGNVYVISNIGSFGTDVFKVGMTRRLDPLDRVRELGDASVPFPFDVHMMISCTDAPALENALHRQLHKLRLNKANPRKEFFKVNVETIARIVREHHGEIRYVVDAEALEYRQSNSMSDEDSEFIERVYDAADEDGKPTAGDC